MKKQVLALATVFTLGAGAFASTTQAAEHKIQSGETLQGISVQYSMTVDELKQLNGLVSDTIYANQSLKVIDDSDLYTVQTGDTLFKIGVSHNASVDQLMKWNNIVNENLIFAGEKIAVTEAAAKPAPVQQATPVQQKQAQKQSQKQAQQPAQNKQAAKSQQQTQVVPTQKTQQSAQPQGKTITVSATAYTAYCAGCSGVTANGTNLRANPNAKVIAVDPKVIPLGSRVYVEGYGEAIAADTGGAIKGNKIDVFFPSQDSAVNWGRRTIQITILN